MENSGRQDADIRARKGKAPGRVKPPAGGSPRQGKAPQGGFRAEPWYPALGTVHTSPHLTHGEPPKSNPRRAQGPGRGKPPAGESPRQGKAPGRGKPPAGESPRQGGSRAEPWYRALETVHIVAQKRQRFEKQAPLADAERDPR
eukprot:scaffold4513_cov57-Phaeocystis_antarctica.AAC.2